MERIAHRYGLEAGFRSLRVEGLSTMQIRSLWISRHDQPADTLLSLEWLNVKLRFLPLLRQNLKVEAIAADSLHLLITPTVMKVPTVMKASSPTKENSSAEQTSTTTSNYIRQSRRSLRLLFDLLPADATLSRVHLTHMTDSLNLQVNLPRLELQQHHFYTSLQTIENGQSQRWLLLGVIHPTEQLLQLSVATAKQSSTAAPPATAAPPTTASATERSFQAHRPPLIPYLKRRFGAEASFDSLSISLQVSPESSSERLSPAHVTHPQAERPSTIHAPHPQAEQPASSNILSPSWHFQIKLHKPWFPAQQLFASLPRGLFSNLHGIATRGELAYDLLFDLDLNQPDSLQLYSSLQRRHFSILHFGETPLDRMSDEFLYTAYEQGEPIRTFPVGPSWEHFIPLHDIPQLLQTAVLQSEDGGFFHHQGFLPDALRDALAYDIKLRRFARGGSTISMQLVKNVFLSRDKNLARKLEEALIVWLIEQQRLTSKERMLEVYFNIAEWGPMVYGLREAAHYYFSKSPQQLTPEECIFLATIIPRPKHWMWSFTPEGTLRDSQEPHFRMLADRLVNKGWLTPEEAAQISIHHLHLKGEAARQFMR